VRRRISRLEGQAGERASACGNDFVADCQADAVGGVDRFLRRREAGFYLRLLHGFAPNPARRSVFVPGFFVGEQRDEVAGLDRRPELLWVQRCRLRVRILRLQRQEGPGWRRMIRMRIAFCLVRLSRAVLDLTGIVAPWLAGDAYFKRRGTP
jgi:hypothetical protein